MGVVMSRGYLPVFHDLRLTSSYEVLNFISCLFQHSYGSKLSYWFFLSTTLILFLNNFKCYSSNLCILLLLALIQSFLSLPQTNPLNLSPSFSPLTTSLLEKVLVYNNSLNKSFCFLNNVYPNIIQ